MKVYSAVNKIIFGMWFIGTILLLPTHIVKTLPGVHFSAMHWIPKKGTESGRVIGDTSNDPNGQSLNDSSHEVKEAAKLWWGPIEHHTLQFIIEMILSMIDKHGWDNIELWKMDLIAAFALIRMHEEHSIKLAFELTEGITAVHLQGFFGWAGTPYAFQVCTRLLQYVVNDAIDGVVLLYADDFMGFSEIIRGVSDRNISRNVTKNMMGINSIAENKREMGRVVEMIGWLVNLNSRRVSLSERNHHVMP